MVRGRFFVGLVRWKSRSRVGLKMTGLWLGVGLYGTKELFSGLARKLIMGGEDCIWSLMGHEDHGGESG